MSEQKNLPVVKESTGIYTVGDVVFIDYQLLKTKMDTPAIAPFGATPPDIDSIWDWSRDEYYGDFSMEERVFTNYRFIGCSQYYVSVEVTYDRPSHINNGLFTIRAIQDNNGYGASYNGTGGSVNRVCFYNCLPTEKLAFAVSKAYDGATASGWISVSNR